MTHNKAPMETFLFEIIIFDNLLLTVCLKKQIMVMRKTINYINELGKKQNEKHQN